MISGYKMIFQFLCIVPLVVGLTEASAIDTDHSFTIEVKVFSPADAQRVNVKGEVEAAKPLKLSVYYDKPQENKSEVVDVKARVSIHYENTEQPDIGNMTNSEARISKNVTVHTCWKGYELGEENGCYKRFPTFENWNNAARKCEEDGAHLPAPETRKHLEEVIRFAVGDLASNEQSSIWLGIQKLEGIWQTVFDTPINPTSWARGKPNESGDCAYVLSTVLHNSPCRNSRTYICEQPLHTINKTYTYE